jgi:hypothetical protein
MVWQADVGSTLMLSSLSYVVILGVGAASFFESF